MIGSNCNWGRDYLARRGKGARAGRYLCDWKWDARVDPGRDLVGFKGGAVNAALPCFPNPFNMEAVMAQNEHPAVKDVDARAKAMEQQNAEFYARVEAARPTPSSAENDLARLGVLTDEKEHDGSEDDFEGQRRVMESRLPGNNPYETRNFGGGGGEEQPARRGPGRPRKEPPPPRKAAARFEPSLAHLPALDGSRRRGTISGGAVFPPDLGRLAAAWKRVEFLAAGV
jgi:hypothetical protein